MRKARRRIPKWTKRSLENKKLPVHITIEIAVSSIYSVRLELSNKRPMGCARTITSHSKPFFLFFFSLSPTSSCYSFIGTSVYEN